MTIMQRLRAKQAHTVPADCITLGDLADGNRTTYKRLYQRAVRHRLLVPTDGPAMVRRAQADDCIEPWPRGKYERGLAALNRRYARERVPDLQMRAAGWRLFGPGLDGDWMSRS